MKSVVFAAAVLLGACGGSGSLEEGELASSSSAMTDGDDKENTGVAAGNEPAPVESSDAEDAGAPDADAGSRDVGDNLAKSVLVRAYRESHDQTEVETNEKILKLVNQLAAAGNEWAVEALASVREECNNSRDEYFRSEEHFKQMIFLRAFDKMNAMRSQDQSWMPTLIEEYKKQSILVPFSTVGQAVMQIARDGTHPQHSWARATLRAIYKETSGHGLVPFSAVGEDVMAIARDSRHPEYKWAQTVLLTHYKTFGQGGGLVPFSAVSENVKEIARDRNHPENEWARQELIRQFQQQSPFVPFSTVALEVLEMARDTSHPQHTWALATVQEQRRQGSPFLSPSMMVGIAAE